MSSHLTQALSDSTTVCDLIQVQRRLANSKHPFERLVGVFFTAGMLNERLAQLSDRQVGQLMVDYAGHDFGIAQPETAIWRQAIRRLFRSAGGSLPVEATVQQEQPACPDCGNEMFLHFGIEEPDFYQCEVVGCAYKTTGEKQ